MIHNARRIFVLIVTCALLLSFICFVGVQRRFSFSADSNMVNTYVGERKGGSVTTTGTVTSFSSSSATTSISSFTSSNTSIAHATSRSPISSTTATSSSVKFPNGFTPTSANDEPMNTFPSSEATASQPKDGKNFIYLIQTESCIAKVLKEQNALGNADKCNCDILVLSYQTPCREPPLDHLEYVYRPSIPWTPGRNTLFELSQNRTRKYTYYLFMDDDIVLTNPAKPDDNPWRLFEEWLLTDLPALGIADSSDNPRLPNVYKARQKLNCPLNIKTKYYPSPRFDACYNAFHRDAVAHLLPYLGKYDHVSWWFSGLFIEIKSEVVFPGQVVIHTDFLAMNVIHRNYRRKFADAYDLKLLFEDVAAGTPERYRNASILQEMKRNGINHEFISSTFCLPPSPPRSPIVPYRLVR